MRDSKRSVFSSPGIGCAGNRRVPSRSGIRHSLGKGKRARRIGIVAVARKLVIALWRYVTTGVVPAGAIVKSRVGERRTASHARGAVRFASGSRRRNRHEGGTAALVSGLRLHSLWGPRACVRARIEGEDWVTDPDVARTRVSRGTAYGRCPCDATNANHGPRTERAAHSAHTHHTHTELDSGPQHRRHEGTKARKHDGAMSAMRSRTGDHEITRMSLETVLLNSLISCCHFGSNVRLSDPP